MIELVIDVDCDNIYIYSSKIYNKKIKSRTKPELEGDYIKNTDLQLKFNLKFGKIRLLNIRRVFFPYLKNSTNLKL